jgi:hypothetical protein
MGETKKRPPAKKRPNIVVSGRELEELALGAGLAGLAKRELPAKVAWWIGRGINRVQQEWKTYNATRKTVLEAYAKKDATGNVKFKDAEKAIYDVPPEKEAALQTEMEEMRATKIDLGIQQLEMTGDEICDALTDRDILIPGEELAALQHFTADG